MLDQPVALNPGALETNRAGLLSNDQRAVLQARATAAIMASVGLPLLVVITAVAGVIGPRALLAVALIGALAVPVALWAFDRIRADMRNGRVIRVVGIPSVSVEDDYEDCIVRVVLKGRRFKLPCSAASIVNQPGPIAAYFTPWSGMLVNVEPASFDE